MTYALGIKRCRAQELNPVVVWESTNPQQKNWGLHLSTKTRKCKVYSLTSVCSKDVWSSVWNHSSLGAFEAVEDSSRVLSQIIVDVLINLYEGNKQTNKVQEAQLWLDSGLILYGMGRVVQNPYSHFQTPQPYFFIISCEWRVWFCLLTYTYKHLIPETNLSWEYYNSPWRINNWRNLIYMTMLSQRNSLPSLHKHI